jgi:hypothetical protein
MIKQKTSNSFKSIQNSKNAVTEIYKSLLNRHPTNYEASIYGEALFYGLNKDTLKSIIMNSNEFSQSNVKKIIKNNYKNKYKVAVCMSGHIRNIKNIDIQMFLDCFSQFDFDIYAHTWSSSGEQIASKSRVGIEYSDKNNLSNIEYFIKNFNPKNILIEDDIDFSGIAPKNFYFYGSPVSNGGYVNATAMPKNILSQFYSMKKSYEIIDFDKSQYDFIIKSRFDFKLTSQIKEIDIDSIADNSLHALSSKNGFNFENCSMCNNKNVHYIHDNLINDFFFVGKQKPISNLFNTFDSSLDIYGKMMGSNSPSGAIQVSDIHHIKDRYPCFIPENILRYSLAGLNIINLDLNGYVVR